MTHCVHLVAQTFYKVYIEDENCEFTDEQVKEKAREEFLNGEGMIDEEIEVEDQDIVDIWYAYNF